MTRFHTPYFFTDASLISSEEAIIRGADADHLVRVRRASLGDKVAVSDGAGRVVEISISKILSDEVRGEILSERVEPRERPAITVFQGLARGSKVDIVVQKLVELGVDEVIVFRAGRSLPRWEESRARAARERWETIAREAAKQSRREWLPVVLGPVEVGESASMSGERLPALAADPAATTGLRAALPDHSVDRVSLIVGPEGGLETAELAEFVGAGAVPVWLGRRILRSETAGLALAAVTMFHFGLLG